MTKNCLGFGVIFNDVGYVPCPNLFLSGLHVLATGSGLLQGLQVAFWLIQGPPNLHVAFNKKTSEIEGHEVQGCEVAGLSAAYGP